MSENLGTTQPNIKVIKPRRGRAILFNVLGLIVLLVLAILAGYGSGISTRTRNESSVVSQQLDVQYQHALEDIELGRYANARQRLEWIIDHDPSFPGAQEKLTKLWVDRCLKRLGRRDERHRRRGRDLHDERRGCRADAVIIEGAGRQRVGSRSQPAERGLERRVEIRPVPGLLVGASGARGPFVTAAAARAASADGRDREFTQQALGGDIEYSRDYYLLRFEAIVSDWRLPIVRTPALKLPLRAVSTSIEGRYRIVPGGYAAARLDRLGFSTITGSPEQGTLPWDAPTTRLEVGGGWSLQRNLLLKVAYQYNRREGGPLARVAKLAAAQMVFWF